MTWVGGGKDGTMYDPWVLVYWSKILAQAFLIGKCEDAETKNSCWAKELVKISTIILQHNRITKLPVPWKIQIKVWYTPLSCFYRKPTHVPMKPADHKNIACACSVQFCWARAGSLEQGERQKGWYSRSPSLIVGSVSGTRDRASVAFLVFTREHSENTGIS